MNPLLDSGGGVVCYNVIRFQDFPETTSVHLYWRFEMRNLIKTKVAELISGGVSEDYQNTEVTPKQQVVITPNSDFNLFANSVLLYSHSGLLEKLEEKLGLSAQDANILQQDMLKFLAICGYRDSSGKKVKIAPSGKIDEAWHNFILLIGLSMA